MKAGCENRQVPALRGISGAECLNPTGKGPVGCLATHSACAVHSPVPSPSPPQQGDARARGGGGAAHAARPAAATGGVFGGGHTPGGQGLSSLGTASFPCCDCECFGGSCRVQTRCRVHSELRNVPAPSCALLVIWLVAPPTAALPYKQVLHVRDYPRATLCELCEQSLHAFVSFSTVACSPPALKVGRGVGTACLPACDVLKLQPACSQGQPCARLLQSWRWYSLRLPSSLPFCLRLYPQLSPPV